MYNFTYLSPREERLSIFKQALGIDNWQGLQILDYGGNNGNLLRDGLATGDITESNYTCLDVDQETLRIAKNEFPNARWLPYNRPNPVYNPTGHWTQLPFMDLQFDIACAYGVHSHLTYEDLYFDLMELKRVAKHVAVSVVDEQWLKRVAWKRMHDHGDNIHPKWKDPSGVKHYRYYIDHDQVMYKRSELPVSCDHMVTLYNMEWLQEKHPQVTIKYIEGAQPILIL